MVAFNWCTIFISTYHPSLAKIISTYHYSCRDLTLTGQYTYAKINVSYYLKTYFPPFSSVSLAIKPSVIRQYQTLLWSYENTSAIVFLHCAGRSIDVLGIWVRYVCATVFDVCLEEWLPCMGVEKKVCATPALRLWSRDQRRRIVVQPLPGHTRGQ